MKSNWPLEVVWRRGFTIIEILVVIVVIGILASLMLPVLGRTIVVGALRWRFLAQSRNSNSILDPMSTKNGITGKI